MRAQVVLTPAESKKLIAKATARMDNVRKALSDGIVVLHPSSNTYFLFEEITGAKPTTDVWVCGWIGPHGLCIEMGHSMSRLKKTTSPDKKGSARDPEDFDHSWVIHNGKVRYGMTLRELFAKMGPGDIYVKSVNTLDGEGNAGVLIGNPVGAGTIGRVMAASKKRGFSIIFLAGLEKLIPGTVKSAAVAGKKGGFDYAMGIPCWLFPVKGKAITEMDAIQLLTGASAVAISSGGLGGAEGAVTLVIKGRKDQVTRAIEYVEASKGARLPPVRKSNCHTCPVQPCTFPPKDKPWV